MIGTYVRISREESGKLSSDEDSNSIDNQIRLIEDFIRKNSLGEHLVYKDDGYSGTDFNRPALRSLFNDINTKKIQCVIVKDLSRLGRDYIVTGYMVEKYFPDNGIRFIAINDDVDTAGEDNELLPFKNIFNDWYARDISRKIRSSKYARALTGQRINKRAPYGFIIDDSDKSFTLIPDETKRSIINYIFESYAKGDSVKSIVDYLAKNHVLSPLNAWKMNKTYALGEEKALCVWNSKTIYDILKREEYIGNLVSLRRRRISYKNHKEVKNSDDRILKFMNTHKSVIDLKLWDEVQKRLKKTT